MKEKLFFYCTILLLISFAGLSQTACFKEDYETDKGWDGKKNYFSSPSACAGYLPLSAPFAQGTISVTNGKVIFDNVRGALENRQFKNMTTAFDRGFEAKFELNVSQMAAAAQGVGIIPFTLVSDWRLEPTYQGPTTAGMCGKFSPMDEIGIICNSNTSGGNLSLSMLLLDDGANVSPVFNPVNSILITYATTIYVTLKVASNGAGTLSAYSNAGRTILLKNGAFCFQVPSTINTLTYLQHSTLSGGGINRLTSAWVDNVSICKIQQSCCKIKVDGENIICNARITANNTYTVFNDVNADNLSIEVLPADVQKTVSGNAVTITSWGGFTEAPKKVTIIAKSSSCECGYVADTSIVYVHPALNSNFNINSAGNTGNLLNDFNAVSSVNLSGVINQWEFHTSDAAGNYGAQIRDAEWNDANGAATYKIFAKNLNASHLYQASYPDLVVGQYYLIKHIMFFRDGLCAGDAESKAVFYIGPNFRIINLGNPADADYKSRAQQLLKSINN